MPFIHSGDFMMPSVAITAARFAAKHSVGVFGENLFANTIVDPSKQDANGIIMYQDSDGGNKEGGALRTLATGPAWFVDQMMVYSWAEDSADSVELMRKHVNFLCSIRNMPVFCEEDHIWYRFIHIALDGRAKRTGKTIGGMEEYQATIRVAWRPMSIHDRDYVEVTGIEIT